MTSFVPTSEKIDMEKLKLKEPILFYDEIHLYEDELADNGCALCTVKIRVMASGWFALLRFYLRVDHVLIRVPPTVWRDPNQVWPHLTLVKEVVEKLTLPS
ncbi:unnamed protein product [Darwinula stevensoni]|uniref:TIP41-like protein n=1 Tax=Darwinula stevensoni TaxID=69355 RepID=A0A7R9AA92_9CRUS|nr:unnamed protein product [Darwinula stevensoni]CAG0898194.1 unnamed protein product [Darwinula stevensoni]